MRASRLVRLALLVAPLISCRDITAPDSNRSALEANRAKWAEHGYTSYFFTLRMDCFCAINGPVTVWVVNDTLSRVTLSGSGTPINAPRMPTIKGLFDVIDADIQRNAAVLKVTYHPTLGYPTEIISDPIANAVDDEVTYTVSDVSPIPPPPGRFVP